MTATTTRPKPEECPPLVIDTREQAPYSFDRPTVRRALKTGDYSVEGLEDQVAVERKELGDFLGCLTNSRDRFDRELERGAAMRRLWVVIESDLRKVSAGEFRNMVPSESVLGSVAAWENRFDTIRFVWASDRCTGQRITEKLLVRAWLDHATGRVW